MKKALLAFIFCAPLLLQAQTFDYSNKIGLGASFGYNTPVFGNYLNDQADGKETYSIHARYHIDSSYGLELSFTRYEFKNSDNPFKVTDIAYFKRFMPLSRFTPIAGLGLGIVDISEYNPDNLKLGLKLRGGLEYALNQDFSLALNLDYQHVNKMFFADNLPSRTAHIMAARMGLTWYFGKADSSAIQVLAKKEEPKKVEEKKTPATKKYDEIKHALKTTGKANVTLKVQFELGKTEVDKRYDTDLRELAQFMKENPKTKIEIQGHTDTTGGAAFNKMVSQKRADSVRNYLVNILKADATRLISVGYGQTVPVQSNKTREGRIANRRVVATISE